MTNTPPPANSAPGPLPRLPSLSGTRPVALVTGGTRRVGDATARALHAAGCDVLITRRSTTPQALPAHVAGAIDLELSDLDGVERVGQMLARDLVRLDVLVHNASAYFPTPLASVTGAQALDFAKVNAIAPLLLSRALAPRLAQSTLAGPNGQPIGGAIVTMCDIHAMGELGQVRRDFVAYAMSKAALLEMTLVLARELAPKVRVNAVAPGVVAFPESGHESDPAVQARYLSRVPLERAGTPSDAAQAVCWLALHAAYCTGQVIRVDGGRAIT